MEDPPYTIYVLYVAFLFWPSICAMSSDIQQCGILTSEDSDDPVEPPFNRRDSKLCLVSSLTVIKY